MIAVIAEMWVAEGMHEDYLAEAARLKPLVEAIEGFLGVERYQSLADPAKILSLSLWENQEAVNRWKQLPAHMSAQARGRNEIFSKYTIRITVVERDYTHHA